MIAHRFKILVLICLCACIIFPVIALSSDEGTDRKAINNLLNELENKIENADKRMIAHPNFLKELRALVEKYRSKLSKIFFSEDFSDGNYTQDPKWYVISGQFRITSSQRLESYVTAERPVERAPESERKDLFGSILGEVLKSKNRSEERPAPAPEPKEASIRTFAKIGPAFEVDLYVVSESKWGSMEVVLIGGKEGTPFYRMVYHASPSTERPIEIVRERDSRSYLIEAATKYPVLDDGTPHRVQWIRDIQGTMKVLIDGKEVLSTVELFYNEGFSGISLINRGGTYSWGPIKISEAPRE